MTHLVFPFDLVLIFYTVKVIDLCEPYVTFDLNLICNFCEAWVSGSCDQVWLILHEAYWKSSILSERLEEERKKQEEHSKLGL